MTLNPVALKELRQLMRTRLIWLMLVGYPVLLFIIFGFAVTAARHEADAGSEILGDSFGKNPFIAVAITTGAVVGIALPLVASLKAIFECVKGRMGLEFTTALTPAQIVNGKLMATSVLAASLVAVSLPFFSLTYLMRGVQLASVFVLPLLLLLFGLIQTAMGLSVATLNFLVVPLRILGILGAIAGGGAVFLLFLDEGANWLVNFSWSKRFVFDWTAILLIALSALVFFIRMAAAHVSPPFADSERPLRKATFVLLALTLPIAFLVEWEVWSFGWGLVALILAARSILLSRPMPRTVQVRAPQSFLGRIFSFPFATGNRTGMLFAILVFLLSAPPGYFLCHNRDWIVYVLGFSETLVLLLWGEECHRWFRSPRAPLITVIVIGVWIFFANCSEILVLMNVLSQDLVHILICNFNGIDVHPVRHMLIIGILLMPGGVLFALNLFREFRSFRRP